MQAFLAEASGIIVSSGILLAASTFLQSNEELPSSADRNAAVAMVNEALAKSSSSALCLTPELGAEAYEKLIHVLAKIGLRSEYSAKHFGLDVDLTHLLLPNLSFSNERKLFTDLVKAGLILAPGEAHGFEVPGHFVLSCPKPDDSAFQQDLITRFQALIAIRDPHSAAARNAHAKTDLGNQSSQEESDPVEQPKATNAAGNDCHSPCPCPDMIDDVD